MTQYYDIVDKFGRKVTPNPGEGDKHYTFTQAFVKVRQLNQTGINKPYRYVEVKTEEKS